MATGVGCHEFRENAIRQAPEGMIALYAGPAAYDLALIVDAAGFGPMGLRGDIGHRTGRHIVDKCVLIVSENGVHSVARSTEVGIPLEGSKNIDVSGETFGHVTVVVMPVGSVVNPIRPIIGSSGSDQGLQAILHRGRSRIACIDVTRHHALTVAGNPGKVCNGA